MKIQAPLDLCTFELSRFRIWNQSSTPSDYGDGTKYFNTNPGHEAYNREQIYTATGWRTAAYLDDIDKINKKLDLIFGDELDTDTIIDSWKEVQDFLAGIEDTKTLMTMLDGKLDKTGGTIRGDNNIPLTISQPGLGNTWIKFTNATNTLGYIGFSSSGGLAMMPSDGSNTYSVIHSGNVGEYTAGAANHLTSTEVNGEGSDNILDDIFTKKSGISVNIARNLGSGSLFVSRDTIVVNYSWGGRYGQQWAIEDTSHKILVRTKNADLIGAVWSDWKTIAFTDSDITGNAATATKLKESVTLWGNTFDGTQNLNGTMHFGNGSAKLYVTTSDEKGVEFLTVNNSGSLLLGQGVAQNEGNTLIYGNNIKFCYGTAGSSANTAMTITDKGNVLVGDMNPLSRRFAVRGGSYFYTYEGSQVELGKIGNNSLLIGTELYGMQHWTYGDQGYIQVGNFNGTATAYALNLNPLGGTVNVGEGGLNVAGDITLGHGNYIKFKDSDGTNNISVLSLNGTDFTVGQGAAEAGRSTYLYGQSITFKIGSSQNTALTINSYGNVSIGRQDLALSEQRFNVHNLFAIYGDPNSHASSRLNIEEIYRSQGNAVHLYVAKNNDNTRVDLPLVLQNGYGFVGIGTLNPSAKLDVAGTFRASDVATFNGGVLIPTGQKLTLGDANGDHATIEYDSEAKAIKVDGNLYTTGTLASGGEGEKGETTGGGGSSVYPVDYTGNGVFDIENIWNSEDLAVMVYERNSNNGRWDMILVDTSVAADRISVDFSNAPSSTYKIIIIA